MDLVPEEAVEAAALAQRSPSHKPGPPDPDLVAIWKRTARITLEAAAPLIVAAELDRMVRAIDNAPYPYEVLEQRVAELRASVLRGEGDGGE